MKRFLIIGAIFVGLLLVCGAGILYRQQYNWNGTSRYLVIEIDDSGVTEVWQNQQEVVATYNLKMPYVECWTGKTIALKDALQQKKISIDQLYDKTQSSEEVQWNGEQASVYIYENYQVVVCQDVYYITPRGIAVSDYIDSTEGENNVYKTKED